MIPSKTDTEVISNMSGREIVMQFDPEALVELMGIMTNMYPDPEEAVIREYATNARDAHVEAGNTDPIEVITPSEFVPTLRIIDHGTGLDEHDIETVYSLYGASTKRETNDQVGQYGIGAKSALAYTSQFTVIGIKDGIRTVVSVSKDDDHAGTMTIVEKVETDEPNGVEVSIPAARYNRFHRKAEELFRYWPEGSVLLNGEEPKKIEGLKISEHITLASNGNYDDTDVVVMGGVPYAIPPELIPFKGYVESYRLVAEVEIGSVKITPSRDSLMISKRTRERMEALGVEVKEALKTAAQDDMDKATDPQDAMRKACLWRAVLDPRVRRELLSNLTYKGEEIPEKFAPLFENNEGLLVESELRGNQIFVSKHDSEKPSACTKFNSVAAAVMADGLVVYGYEADKFTAGHKKKLMAYAEQKSLTVRHYVLSAPTLNCRWIDAERVANWEDIKPIKIPRSSTGERTSSRVAGTYNVYLPGTEYEIEIEATAIDTTKPLYYFTKDDFPTGGYYRRDRGQEAKERHWRIAAALIRGFDPEATVVRLGLNRIEKFNRDFPFAKSVKASIEEKADALYDGLNERVRKAWRLQEESVPLLKELDPNKISDPELCEAVELATLSIDAKVQSIKAVCDSRISNSLYIKATEKQRELEPYDISVNYPLLGNDEWRAKAHLDHAYIYIGASYETRIAVVSINTGQLPERKAA